MALAREEMAHYAEYEYLVVNDSFEIALDDLAAIVRARRLLHPAQGPRLGPLLADLLEGHAPLPPLAPGDAVAL